MHELSLTEGIVDICLRHAEGKRIISVTLEIGCLSSAVPEAIEFCFSACSADTTLHGARLVIDRVEGRGCCLACGEEQPVVRHFDPCRRCGGYGVRIVAGEELRVREIEVAD
ncbi:hydrogenase maturation nickel metallochaperone HypA/HybF [Trichlorobacter ammonificans]|uniref:Hydrogenase maturation factor HypA n=1 Tax=Trichlorobacter ammonificans TaxID=2916410 RepID=A0ABM9D9T4_9BACT|nr:hydrogenase maturation nickel metallochaperone HypA [Trichlorobacter ammonificans]CAH2031129.1 Hydrogenase maturation factor HypA [Trichlorobacter ammonificans]